MLLPHLNISSSSVHYGAEAVWMMVSSYQVYHRSNEVWNIYIFQLVFWCAAFRTKLAGYEYLVTIIIFFVPWIL